VITWEIATSHMITSKNPTTGATYFKPFEIKITRSVPRLTSASRAKKMRSGIITHVKTSYSAGIPTIFHARGNTQISWRLK
ncbi:MAG: hypothetical protein PHR63_02700, partial [Methanoregulaceae archaeon]|nr:hypothetical protein [Methanoregulaceae archaeon]